jgi:hypothetical protein
MGRRDEREENDAKEENEENVINCVTSWRKCDLLKRCLNSSVEELAGSPYFLVVGICERHSLYSCRMAMYLLRFD